MKMTCESDRLIYKVLQDVDANLVLEFYTNNKDYFEPWDPKRNDKFYTINYHKASLSCELNQIIHLKAMRYWVFTKDNPNIIGTVSCSHIIRGAFSTCQVGYKFDKNHCNKGYAFEAMNKLIEIMFGEFKLHRMEANIMPNNHSSLRLAEKLGFQYEGTCIDSIQINGRWESHHRYALINNMVSI